MKAEPFARKQMPRALNLETRTELKSEDLGRWIDGSPPFSCGSYP
jgi:hypothetical protein